MCKHNPLCFKGFNKVACLFMLCSSSCYLGSLQFPPYNHRGDLWFLITIFWTLSPFGSVDTKAIWSERRHWGGVQWPELLSWLCFWLYSLSIIPANQFTLEEKKKRQTFFHQYWETKDQRSLITHKILQGHWIKGTIISAKYRDTSKTSCHVFQTLSCCMDCFTFSSALQQRKEIFFFPSD